MTDTPAAAPRPRCAVHPVRRAVDACPVCLRPRCAADVQAAPGGGCLACGGERAPAVRTAPATERLVRAGLACTLVAAPGGYVASEYVGSPVFGYLTPFVLGVLLGATAQTAAGGPRTGPVALKVRGIACALAVLATALGFALEQSVGLVSGRAVLPYVLAFVGAFLWTIPPRTKPAVQI